MTFEAEAVHSGPTPTQRRTVGGTLCAGFAEIEITPPLGTHKIGWLRDIVSTEILSPLYARVAIFETENTGVALVQLDTLFIAWPEVEAIREGVERRYPFIGAHVMVSATHNHAGPAVAHAGDVPKDEHYAQTLVSRVIEAFGQALARLEPTELGFGRRFEWEVAHNRRVVMRNGTARTHGTFDDPEALYLEGPIDPAVGVIAAASVTGELRGVLVNFACHPTHHGGDGAIDAGYPGVLARELRDCGCPATLYLNGASGNVHTADPRAGGRNTSAERVGELLAQDAWDALQEISFERDVRVAAASRTIELPYRDVSDAEIAGQVRGAQRFIDPAIYERTIPLLMDKIRQRGAHRVEIQVILLGDCAIVGVPGELFCEYGLRIKESAYPLRVLVATCTNGRVGYIPTQEAFRRGGYETTFGPSSMLAPEAGDLIVQTAIELIAQAAAAG
jgi:neutral ceramidase